MNLVERYLARTQEKTLWEALDNLRGALSYQEIAKLYVSLAGMDFINEKEGKGLKSTQNWNKEACVKEMAKAGNKYGLGFLIEMSSEVTNINEDLYLSIMNLVEKTTYKDATDFCERAIYFLTESSRNYVEATPSNVLRIPISLFKVKDNEEVVDYFNGTSSLHVEILRENPFSKIRYYGQDISLEAHNIGQFIEFMLSGHSQNIIIGDSLKKPGFLDKQGGLKKFDYAISAPPFGLAIDKELVLNDKFDRFKYMPEKNLTIKSDWIIVQHLLGTVNSNGKVAVLLPLGVLFRMGQESNIRKAILQEDLIEAVIKLPENLFQYSSIGSCWVIFNKQKPQNKRNKIQFIDLTSYLQNIDRRTKGISPEGISEVVDLFNKFKKSRNSLIFSVDELAKRDYTLNAFDFVETERIYEEMNQKLISLKEVAVIRRGVQVTKTKLDSLSAAENKTHYMVSLGNIGQDGNIIVDDMDLIHAENRWVDLYEAREGDILVTSRGNLFKLAIVKNTQEKYIVSSNLFIIRLDQSKYKPELLKFFLESDTGQKLIESIYKGSVITSITNSDLENLLIPEIPIEKQQMLVNILTSSQKEYLENMNAAKSRYENQIQKVNKIVFSK